MRFLLDFSITFIHKHHLNLITLSSLYYQLHYMSPWSSFVFICSPFPPLLCQISSFSPQWEPLNIHPVWSDPSIYLSVLFSVTSSLLPLVSTHPPLSFLSDFCDLFASFLLPVLRLTAPSLLIILRIYSILLSISCPPSHTSCFMRTCT